MQFERKSMRYGHTEGHTDLCYVGGGKNILTCGSDGDVRRWNGIEDDDPTSECVAEMVLCIAYHNERFFVGTDNNYVQAYTLPDNQRDGVICRFSAPVTHIAVSPDGSKIAAAACDMELQVADTLSKNITKFSGHSAPLLGVALDPTGKYVMSTSCDGSVRVWDIDSGDSVKIFPDILPTCNDFFRSTILGRGAWQSGSGACFAVPKNKGVVLYQRDTWDVKMELVDSRINELLTVVIFSPCGVHLAAASVGGEIAVWDTKKSICTSYTQHPRRIAITGMVWHENGNEIAFCDALGQLGVMDKVDKSARNTHETESSAVPHLEDDTQEDTKEGDQDVLDDENAISIRDIKASAGWLSPSGREEREERSSMDRDDDAESRRSEVIKDPPLPELQPAFQPSATPVHLQHRFMVWNAIGIVRCFNTEEDRSVDVEFHDTMFHHGIHLSNKEEYNMAALSDRVLALASQASEDSISKLTCVQLNSWDGSKEWSISLPVGEEATAVAAAGSWVAVTTNRHFLRMLSHAGTQRQIISLPGPVVAISGHQQLLFVVYHIGLGGGLGSMLIQVGSVHLRTVFSSVSVPVSPLSTLKWVGFTDEGTPCVFDSSGILHSLASRSAHWTVACDTTLLRRAPSDHHFVIGVSEKYQNVRCVLCKGSYYPATTPRPTVVEVPLRLPLTDPEAEKSVNEEAIWKSMSALSVVKNLARDNDECTGLVDELEKSLKQFVIKLFANACRNDADMRALDVATMMTTQPLQMAATYASKIGKMYLADKLSHIEPADWHGWTSSVEWAGPNVQEDTAAGTYDSHSRYGIHSQDMFEDSPITTENKLLAAEKGDTSLNTSNMLSEPTPNKGNPFKIKDKASSNLKGLTFFDAPKMVAPIKFKPELRKTVDKIKPKQSRKDNSQSAKPTFVQWFATHKAELTEEFPELNLNELTKAGMKRFREEITTLKNKEDAEQEETETKRRKLDGEGRVENTVRATAANKLNIFAVKKT